MQQMQSHVEQLVAQFDDVINQRIEQRQLMVDELKKIQAKS